jgi:tRNA(fMet)-specific endonuclease VapC
MTAPRYLLDTNIVSDAMRNPRGAVRRKLDEVDEEEVFIDVVVLCELRYGIRKRDSIKLTAQLDEILSALEVLPLTEDMDAHYADIRTALERAGTPIGPYDLLIAAHARSLDLTLVTDNLEEFRRVPGLKVENWLI